MCKALHERNEARGCLSIHGLRRRTGSAYGATVTEAQTANGCTAKVELPLGLKIQTSHDVCEAGKDASTVLLVPLVSGFIYPPPSTLLPTGHATVSLVVVPDCAVDA
jgi:hypothetical protein